MFRRIAFLILAVSMLSLADEMPTIKFDKPDLNEGTTALMAMNFRQSTREYRRDPVPDKCLGHLLWASCGFNRPDKRTAPSAMNRQEISIYVFRTDGIWLYDAKDHSVTMIARGDFRAQTGKQPFVATAPVNLVFVADAKKCGSQEVMEKWGPVDAAFCAANAGIYCASVGLGGVVRGSYPEEELSKLLKLESHQKVVLAMSIGWPL